MGDPGCVGPAAVLEGKQNSICLVLDLNLFTDGRPMGQ